MALFKATCTLLAVIDIRPAGMVLWNASHSNLSPYKVMRVWCDGACIAAQIASALTRKSCALSKYHEAILDRQGIENQYEVR